MATNAAADRWIVAQLGARMHYAVPRILSEAGQLGRFYTDFYQVGLLEFASRFLPAKWKVKADRYRCQAIDPSKVRLAFWRCLWSKWRHGDHAKIGNYYRWCLEHSQGLASTLAADEAWRHGDHFYGFDTASLESLERWRGSGLKVVEQCIAPRVAQLRAPGPPRISPDDAQMRRQWMEQMGRRESAEWELADRILAPSTFVRDELLALGVAPSKIRLVPYGVDPPSSEDWATAVERRRARSEGPRIRVLFAGAVSVRKGAEEMLEAAKLLENEPIDWRIAGAWTDGYRPEEVAKNVVALGKLGMAGLKSEYASADVFVLPTHLEGSATVIYEAMGWGLPVVTTREAGSVIESGVDGVILDTLSAESLAEAVRRLSENVELRESLGQASRMKALQYDVPSYGRRLLAALRQEDA